MNKPQALVGLGVLGVALLLAVGAWDIPKEAGYGGVGANFLPLVVAGALLLCGAGLIWEAASGGFREMEEESAGNEAGFWRGFAWVSAGILLNALLIGRLGFILSCTLCFVLAVRGFKASRGEVDGSARSWMLHALTGFAIAAPVFWMFTKLLNINLPGLTSTGWI